MVIGHVVSFSLFCSIRAGFPMLLGLPKALCDRNSDNILVIYAYQSSSKTNINNNKESEMVTVRK